MNDDAIAAPLAAALSARGYETLTPVQKAMLAPEVAGRDALVSAQTGSGKTVAFGMAIAPDLLRGADRLLFADVPMALIIAPTRELALQVARELDWLYAETGAQIATCVGGMDYRTEKRALDRGAHIVVGTPGRLRDHIDRRSLDLSGLRAAVLDEADEMLDLGFREDLEYILAAAPPDRRTMMFSATVPPAIAALAKDFQRDALRIQTQGEARQHVDIEYRALNVSTRDREHAIFNILRYYEARTAIVFCKTRVNVNHLFARMGNRGFQVVALSGELSQQERTHALQSLRDGRARVCIATDVAARGIDLPGLDLVIHADLPANSETLLHRSGRTGRAGSKGVSALIVTQSEFKKAQRLLQGAKVVAEWAKAPSADEVRARDEVRLLDHPALMQPVTDDEKAMVAAILDRVGPDQAAAAFARLWREGRSAPEELMDSAGPAPSAPKPRDTKAHEPKAERKVYTPKPVRVDVGEAEFAAAPAAAAAPAPVRSAAPAPRPLREDSSPAPRKPYDPDRKPFDPDRKPFPKRDTAAKPYAKRDDAPKPYAKPYAKRDEAPKPYAKRADAAKPYAKAADAPRKPYVKRDEAAAKPFAKRDGDAPKSYAKRDDAPKSFAKRTNAAAKPYAKPADGDRKPYVKRDDAAKPYAKRAEGDGAAPRWQPPKSGGAAARPARSAEGDAPRGKPGFNKAAGTKSHGKPAFAKKPAPRPVDPSDTSKRFVPPKKPRG